MKNRFSVYLAGVAIAMVPAMGAADEGFYARAKVVDATPIYETVRVVTPVERCWREQVRRPGRGHRGSYTPAIAGAIVGGVVGNQFSKGKRRDALTLAGALLGASVGHDLYRGSRGGSYVTSQRRCEVVDRIEEQEQLAGYDVRYRYHGRILSTHTAQHPGSHIPVRVEVAPVVN